MHYSSSPPLRKRSGVWGERSSAQNPTPNPSPFTGRGRKRLVLYQAVVLLTLIVGQLWCAGAVQAQDGSKSKYIPVTKYDPKRNAAQDIEDAIAEAKRTNRRILLEVGGEWCGWCHRLDQFFEAHPELTALRDKHYVTVKINFSEENPNKEVLSRYDPISGYPYIFVLDSDGKLVRSQETGVFEEGKTYVLERLTTFLTHWAPSNKN
jgi:thiol:disulfide interchange protein